MEDGWRVGRGLVFPERRLLEVVAGGAHDPVLFSFEVVSVGGSDGHLRLAPQLHGERLRGRLVGVHVPRPVHRPILTVMTCK